ncbi:MAG: GNAT family N-acetyltransferase [Aristaeellaceae bacterium]
MAKQITRAAREDDALSLAGVKSRYVRALYRGYLPAEFLKQLHETYYLAQAQGWLADGWQAEVLEEDGTVTGFVVYGADPAEEGCGLILEAAILPASGGLDKALLMQAVLDKLMARYSRVHVWTMRDNFRARFLFDSFGFRRDGAQRTVTVEGQTLDVIRLTWITGHSRPDIPAESEPSC